jgi:RimJ/RimL family protein N-acetyltransferase
MPTLLLPTVTDASRAWPNQLAARRPAAFNAWMTEAPPEVLEVPRGRLSRIRESDADELAQAVAASLDHLRPWMPWATAESAEPQAQREHCRDVEKNWVDDAEYVYALRTEPSRQVIGCFGLHRRIGPGAIEIGYWVHVDFTGRGYATACAEALTHSAFGLPDVARVEIHTDEANTISASVPRRLGYRLERIDERPPTAPAESGRLQIWVMERPR